VHSREFSAHLKPGRLRRSLGDCKIAGGASERPAFTMIEMLVSLTITLIMMGAAVSLFA